MQREFDGITSNVRLSFIDGFAYMNRRVNLDNHTPIGIGNTLTAYNRLNIVWVLNKLIAINTQRIA